MRSFKIARYGERDKEIWDDFVASARNGAFLFYRDYMDYHADRFDDHSLLIYSDTGELLAALPANIRGDVLHSHEGLSYGGILIRGDMKLVTFMDLFDSLVAFLRSSDIRELVYKKIPPIYCRAPSDEDAFALFTHGAELYRRDVNSVIDMRDRLPFQTLRKRALNKARGNGMTVERSADFEGFMSLLEQVLYKRHGLTPVHTREEITLLAERFPDNIKLFTATSSGGLLAGVVIYEHELVAHSQYSANSERGMELGALDLIFDFLINGYFENKRYISLGVSTEKEGRYLNRGLVAYKEGFGARTLLHDFYRLSL